MELLDRFWKKFSPIDKITDLDPTPDIFKYAGKKLKKYLAALENLGSHSSAPYYSTFLKIEAAAIEAINKKAVRMITPNNVMFNVLYKNFFSKFEHILLSFKDTTTGLPLFAKGMNYNKRLETIREYSKYFRYVFPTDFKSFDSHHVGVAAEAEIHWYDKLGLPGKVGNKIINAIHDGIVKYFGAQRCSGDLYTGSGNCLTVGSLLFPYTSEDTAFLCDGDDTLIFTNDASVYARIMEGLLEYGYELDDVDPIDLTGPDYQVPFCQALYTKEHFTIDRNRALNKIMNITATNTNRAAEIILGKLQAIQYYSYFNIDFGVDLGPYLKHVEDQDGSLKYKRELIENPEGLHYLDEEMETIHVDLLDKDTGILSEIVGNLMGSWRLWFARIFAWFTPERYRKELIRNIRKSLDDIVARTGKFDNETDDHLERAERIIESAGPMLAGYIMEVEKENIRHLKTKPKSTERTSYITPQRFTSVSEEDDGELSSLSLDSE
jgi:hypothetical protein